MELPLAAEQVTFGGRDDFCRFVIHLESILDVLLRPSRAYGAPKGSLLEAMELPRGQARGPKVLHEGSHRVPQKRLPKNTYLGLCLRRLR